MKTSILAMTAAFALTLGATSVAMSQTATPETTTEIPAGCIVVEDDSVSTTSGEDGNQSSTMTSEDTAASDGPPAEGLTPSLGTDNSACPDIEADDND